MKKVLVTGAAGILGTEVIKSLLTEGKYIITLLDLNNHSIKNKLKKYKRRCRIINGDLNDQNFVDEIIKDFDVIIHLASIKPYYLEFNPELSKKIELNMTENIVRAINYYNPNCKLIYSSTTSVYGDKLKSYNANCVIRNHFTNNWTKAKYKCEELIKNKISDYTIVRFPLILGNLKKEKLIYQFKKDSVISSITKEDAAYLITRILDKKRTCKNKIINASGNKDFIIEYSHLIEKITAVAGLKSDMVLAQTLIDKDIYSPICNDTEYYANLLKYQNDTLNNYLARNKDSSRLSFISKKIGALYLKLWLRKK